MSARLWRVEVTGLPRPSLLLSYGRKGSRLAVQASVYCVAAEVEARWEASRARLRNPVTVSWRTDSWARVEIGASSGDTAIAMAILDAIAAEVKP